MNIYKSKFQELNFFAEKQLIEVIWLPQSAQMYLQDYKQELLNYREKFMEFRPKKVIADMQEMYFTISPEIQEWINTNILPDALAIGLTKVAFIMNHDFITQLSIQQTMEESVGVQFDTRYFVQKQDALRWLQTIN